MTTNLGASVLADVANKDADVREYRDLLFSDLAISLSPEFLGRLTEIVPFQPLSNKILTDIAMMRIKELSQRIYRKHGVRLRLVNETYELPDGFLQTSFTVNKVLAYLVADRVKKDANNGGGRAVARRIESEVASVVAEFLNKHPNAYKSFDYISLSVEGKMVLDDRFDAEGSARIKVTPHVK